MQQILPLLLRPAAVAFCTLKNQLLTPYTQQWLAKLPQLPQHSSPNTIEKAAKPVFPCLNKYIHLYFGHWIKSIQLPTLSCQEPPWIHQFVKNLTGFSGADLFGSKKQMQVQGKYALGIKSQNLLHLVLLWRHSSVSQTPWLSPHTSV